MLLFPFSRCVDPASRLNEQGNVVQPRPAVNLSPLHSDRPLIVYIDFKSPYAYLAVGPTAEMARQLGVAVDWRPFVLDIPSYLGSARLDQNGKVVEQQRTAEQWSGVKYAYFDCRRYASLQDLTVRGTVKIWDTHLAAIGLLWAKQQGDAVVERYLHGIYAPFWKRELDVEDPAVIERVLREAGADVAGFPAYAAVDGAGAGDGAASNAGLQEAAFDAGVFGVPTYVVNGQVYFGREHLPRIRWHLEGEQGAAPDVAYPVPAGASVTPAEGLVACIDFKSPQSYLAVRPTLALARDLGISVEWQPRLTPPLKRSKPGNADDDRGARHRRFRADYLARDLVRYAPHDLPDVHADFDAAPAAMGLLWLQEQAPGQLDRYVERAFTRYWRDRQPIDRLDAIHAVMTELGIDAAGFPDYASGGRGRADLDARAAELAARGVAGTPTYLLGDEPFFGRHHLPLIRARLSA
jgi:2-hydroxychromene-2-carboxylate isomerase